MKKFKHIYLNFTWLVQNTLFLWYSFTTLDGANHLVIAGVIGSVVVEVAIIANIVQAIWGNDS